MVETAPAPLLRGACRRGCPLLLALLLAGCATYHPLPLAKGPALAAHLTLPKGATAGAPLTLKTVAEVALRDSPQLKVDRRRAAEAKARWYAAGRLPDPTFSANLDRLTTHGPGLSDGHSIGLGYDLGALVRHPDRMSAAEAAYRQAQWHLRWQALQTAQRAESLFIRRVRDAQSVAFLRRAQGRYARRYAATERALKAGDVDLATADNALAALAAAQKRLASARRTAAEDRYALNRLLGLRPKVQLTLDAGDHPPFPPAVRVKRALADLPRRRPDLIALRYGYRSQEAQVREAILGQFPATGVSLSRATDTSAVGTVGLGISLVLPLFNGNRGAIAVARATRARLAEEYQNRLDDAYSKVAALQTRHRLLAGQLKSLHRQLPALVRAAAGARRALARGDLDAASWLNLETALLDKRLEAINLQAQADTAAVAMQTLLGSAPPHLSSPSEPPASP